MMTTVAKNNFLEHCENLLNSKPNKEGVRLQKTQYVGNYKAEVMTVTIERGDKINSKPNTVILSTENKVSKLYDLVKIQVKCSRQDLSDQYMRGMANGLICALAVFKEWEPIYIEKRTELEITHANQLRAIKFCPSKKKHGEVICPKCMPIFKALGDLK
jgi:trehalose-6-phosphate synthase